MPEPEPGPEPVASSTMAELDDLLLGGSRSLTARDLAAQTGLELAQVQRFWRTLGQPAADPDERRYTRADLEAISRLGDLADIDGLAWRTIGSLVRATGHSADRLAMWHVESLVEDFASRYDLDDVSARLVVLDQLSELAPTLEAQLVHAWRRQLAAVAGRIAAEFAEAHAPDVMDRHALPLARAVGFADMVDFTRLVAGMDYTQLAEFVRRFEAAARDVVTAHGGRVVKTIGDAILFVADDPATGAAIALALAARAQEPLAGARVAERIGGPVTVEVRVGLVWGRVLARFGDVFGPPVNLAARLTAVAEPGWVLIDEATAAELGDAGATWTVVPQEPVDLPGLGAVAPVRLVARGG